MQYTNNKNVSLAVAVFLANDTYDHEDGVISATSLMKPTRMLVLENRLADEDKVEDIAGLVASRMGTAIHDGIERAWLNPKEALKSLGHPKGVYENILINPTPEQLQASKRGIPIYMEQRSYKMVHGYKVSGKFDFVGEGIVQDFKSTSVWNYVNQRSVESYKLQLSIYRWLNPTIITEGLGMIHYFFTDWAQGQVYTNKQYPPNRVLTQKFELRSLEATEQYVNDKVQKYINCLNLPEPKLPKCTDADLWTKETVWKYYKDPNKTAKSTKNFDNAADAALRLSKDGHVGIVKEIKGQVIRCKYCSAFSLCTQKDLLIQEGRLSI